MKERPSRRQLPGPLVLGDESLQFIRHVGRRRVEPAISVGVRRQHELLLDAGVRAVRVGLQLSQGMGCAVQEDLEQFVRRGRVLHVQWAPPVVGDGLAEPLRQRPEHVPVLDEV